VRTARERSVARQGTVPNARLPGRDLDRWAALDEASRSLLGRALTELGLSARAFDKVRRVARTIADLEGSERIELAHVAEAVQYRLLDRRQS
jgi:magnesium chelatase family protein